MVDTTSAILLQQAEKYLSYCRVYVEPSAWRVSFLPSFVGVPRLQHSRSGSSSELHTRVSTRLAILLTMFVHTRCRSRKYSFSLLALAFFT